jgi:hypothetical protein
MGDFTVYANMACNYAQIAYDSAKEYCREMPENTARQMLSNGAASFVISTVLSRNPVVGILGGAIAITATAVYALITPLFRWFIGQRRQLTWGEEIVRTAISAISVGTICAAFGNRSILDSLFVTAVLQIAFTPDRTDVNRTKFLITGFYVPRV